MGVRRERRCACACVCDVCTVWVIGICRYLRVFGDTYRRRVRKQAMLGGFFSPIMTLLLPYALRYSGEAVMSGGIKNIGRHCGVGSRQRGRFKTMMGAGWLAARCGACRRRSRRCCRGGSAASAREKIWAG